MTKSLVNKLIYLRLALLTSLSLVSMSWFWLQADAKTETSEPSLMAAGKNNYLDFQDYGNEVEENNVPKVIFKEELSNCQTIIDQQLPASNCPPSQPQKSVNIPPPKSVNIPSQKADIRFPLTTVAEISSPFGWRLNPLTQIPQIHEGIDFAAPIGTPVIAVASGEVAIAGSLSGYGLTVIMRHHNNTRESRYAHLSKVLVQPGQKIEVGTVVGLVGNTGLSTGPHLHFEWRELKNGGWVATNPDQLISQARIAMIAAQKTAILPTSQPKPSLLPEEYSRAPRFISSTPVEKEQPIETLPLNFALRMPNNLTSSLLRRFFRLPEHFS